MTPAESIEYVRRYQQWRRGDERTFDEMGLDVVALGKAIDAVVELAERAEAAEAEKHRLLGQIVTMIDEREAADLRFRAAIDAGDILRNAAVMAMDENKDYPALDKAIIRWDATIDAARAACIALIRAKRAEKGAAS